MVSRKKAKGKARKAAKAAKNDVTPAVDDHGHNHNQQPHHQQQLESLEEQMERLKILANKNLFTIKQNEFGNLSAYANNFIPKHTLLFAELPALRGQQIENVTQLHEDGIHQCRADDDTYLQNVLGIDASTRESIWALHDQYTETYLPSNHPLYSPNEKRVLGIIKSNAYHSNDEGSRGLYSTISRFNHSCKPNVGYGFNGWEMRL